MESIDWNIIFNYKDLYLAGMKVTLQLMICIIIFSTILGYIIALMRLSHNKVLSWFAFMYVWFFRGLPELLLLFFFYFAMPFDIRLDAFTAAVMAMSISSAAFVSEIIRAGIMSVNKGQLEAAEAVGMSPLQKTLRVTAPQTLRLLLPPFINNCVLIIKGSALVSVITVPDLMFQAQKAYSSTFKVAETLGVAAVIYLTITTILMLLQYVSENKLRIRAK